MIALIVEEDQNVVSSILSALRKAGGQHEVRTAGSFDTARKAAARLDELDVLITTTMSSDGSDGFTLRDEIKPRFPHLRTAFLNEIDLAPWAKRIGLDQVFPKPPPEADLLAWAAEVGICEGGERSEPVARSAIPVAVEEDDDEDDEEIPVADTVAAPGKRLGDYELVRLISADLQTETHQAIQRSIERRVALVLLRPELATDNAAVREFRGLVRARARVSHPHIAPVYEGYEEGGAIFYTRELIDGKNLPELYEAGQKIDDATLVAMVRAIAEALSYLESNGITHDQLRTRHIYLGADLHTRLANTATFAPQDTMSPVEQIRYLGAKLKPFLQEGGTGVGNHLLAKMREPSGPRGWEDLLRDVASAEKDIAERTTYRVKTTRLRKKTRARSWLGGAGVAIAVVLLLLRCTDSGKTPPEPRELDVLVRIRGGVFIYGKEGKTLTMPTFWMDRGEVTIAEYAEFLKALGNPPSKDHDHSDQPADKRGHKPANWDEYYDAALRGARYQDHLIDVNCPVAFVDWWDAYAYAKWRGRRLPTEVQWEVTARGKAGRLYPWGNKPDPEKLKSTAGEYAAWKPVDSVPGDVTEGGIHGMAGNVSEWTASLTDHPDLFGRQVPVVRGGSFDDDPAALPDLTAVRVANDFSEVSPYVGFRTLSDTEPNLGD